MISEFFSKCDGKEIAKLSMALFAVLDMPGLVPIISKMKKESKIEASKSTLTVAIIGFLFLAIGVKLLDIYNISFSAFRAAGGLVLFVLGIELVFDLSIHKTSDKKNSNPSITPLGFPLIAGPGTLTTLVLFQDQYQLINIIIAFSLNLIVVYLLIRYVEVIERLVGNLVMKVFTKTIGLLLISMGIQSLRYGFTHG